LDKRLNPLVKNYIPNRPTAMTSITITKEESPPSQETPVRQNKNNNTRTGMTLVIVNYNNSKTTEVTPATQYCGEHYDERHAWKDIQAEQQEYIEILPLQNENIHTENLPHNIQDIPCIPKNNIPTTTPPIPQVP